MLAKTVSEVANCYAEADKCRTAATSDPDNADFWRRQQALWLVLAQNVEFQRRLARGILNKLNRPSTTRREETYA